MENKNQQEVKSFNSGERVTETQKEQMHNNLVDAKKELDLLEAKELVKKARKEHKNRYPVVMKNSKTGLLEVIYENRVELYKLENTDTFDKEDENKVNDAYAEIDMALGCNMKRVHDTTEEDDWRFK